MKEIHCNDCRHWGSKGCPSSEKCYALADKPYFERKKQKEGFFRLIRGRLADKLARYIERKREEIENEPCEMSPEELACLFKELEEKQKNK